MNWFDSAGFASFAKSALTTAQKTIDKALDIQDERNPSRSSSSYKITDGDSFFAAFGLAPKPLSPQEKPSDNQTFSKNKTSMQSEPSSTQNSGFWTDAWGSYFEARPQSPTVPELGSIAESDAKCSVSDKNVSNQAIMKESTVLSQPARVGLFPGQVKSSSVVPQSKDKPSDEILNSEPCNLSTEDPGIMPLEATALEENHPKLLESNSSCVNNSEGVTLQFHDENVVLEETALSPSQPSSEKEELPESQDQRETVTADSSGQVADENADEDGNKCDSDEGNINKPPPQRSEDVSISTEEIEACKNSSTKDNFPNIIDSGSCVKQLEESQFFSLQLSGPAPNIDEQKSELGSDYDVIEIEDKCFKRTSKQSMSDSLDGLPSVEVISPASSSSLYVECTPLDFPQLHTDVTGSFINWEWGPVDIKKSDLCVSNNATLVSEGELSRSSSNPVSPSDSDQVVEKHLSCQQSSFDVLSSSSVSEGGHWIEKSSTSHYTDCFVDTSPEEQISSNIDEQSMSSKDDDDDTETADVKECEVKSSDSGGSHATTSSSSFVKCSVEDADGSSHRGQSPFSVAASERSDIIKVGSEENSGHTSGEENETATSSDIEILSPPNGENGERHSNSPLRHMWVPQPLRSRRSESPASDSSKDSTLPVVREVERMNMKGSLKSGFSSSCKHKDFKFESTAQKHLQKNRQDVCNGEQLIIIPSSSKLLTQEANNTMKIGHKIRETVKELIENSGLGNFNNIAEDALQGTFRKIKNKYQTTSTLYKSLHEPENFEKLIQKQEELHSIIEAREAKLLDLSRENIKLQETVEQLQNQMKHMAEAHTKDSKDISALTKEFTQRLAQMEDNLQHTFQERDSYKKQLDELQKEVALRVTTTEMEGVIKEKDEQIKELQEEGEKLSKKELHHMNIIKKLRAKEDEMEHTIKTQREKLEENVKEVERLRKSLGAKDEQEKKHIDAIRQLTSTVQQQDKEIAIMKSNLEDYTEKERSLKNSLETTYKELAELQKTNAAKESQVQEFALSVEMAAQEKLRQSLEQANKEAKREKESLLIQMEDLRGSLLRSEEEAHLREKMLKADIASLQLRLQESEARNEELTKNMSSATRPLVRQIENLQATYNSQIASWEKVEKNLSDRLAETQKQLALCSEKERSSSEKYMELASKVTKLESQNSSLRQEKLQLSSEIETLNAKIVMLEDSKNRDSYNVDNLKQSLSAEITKLKEEKEILASDMLVCLDQLETEKKKVQELKEDLKLKETKLQMVENISPCPSPSLSHKSSVDSIHNWIQEDHPDPLATPTTVNSYRLSVYESLRLGSTSSLLENLQSQLKQREGEINQLQSEIARLERVRESMAHELVDLSEHNEALQTELDKLKNVQEEYTALDQKYNTLLQMYGEKVEEADELHLDLEDVKSMYKAQIEELLRRK